MKQFNRNLLRVLGLTPTGDTSADHTLDQYRDRLEAIAREGLGARSGAVPSKRRLPPPVAVAAVAPGPASGPAETPLAPGAGTGAGADAEPPQTSAAESGTAEHGGVATTQTDGVTPSTNAAVATVRGAEGGYGTFAVLQPKVAVTKTARRSVRSSATSAGSRAEAAQLRAGARAELRAGASAESARARPLVRTAGGFVVPAAPAPLYLPEIALPPAPTASAAGVGPGQGPGAE